MGLNQENHDKVNFVYIEGLILEDQVEDVGLGA